MITLVIGTPDSGKSALAEDLTLRTGAAVRYYLATMKVDDDAAAERVKKHKKQREGKGFLTIECCCGIPGEMKEMKDLSHAAVLLECVSNLVGNEMHDVPERAELCRKGPGSEEHFADEVMHDIKILGERARDLIIVTNEYEADGTGYDDDTRLYVRLLGLVNARLSAYADRIFDLRIAGHGKDGT